MWATIEKLFVQGKTVNWLPHSQRKNIKNGPPKKSQVAKSTDVDKYCGTSAAYLKDAWVYIHDDKNLSWKKVILYETGSYSTERFVIQESWSGTTKQLEKIEDVIILYEWGDAFETVQCVFNVNYLISPVIIPSIFRFNIFSYSERHRSVKM